MRIGRISGKGAHRLKIHILALLVDRAGVRRRASAALDILGRSALLRTGLWRRGLGRQGGEILLVTGELVHLGRHWDARALHHMLHDARILRSLSLDVREVWGVGM